MGRIPLARTVHETVEAAILLKRAQDLKRAHHLFAEAYSVDPNDPKIVHEFAQTKVGLARSLWKRKDIETKKRLNREAAELLRRAIQLSENPVREAWCWFDLARILDWLRAPYSEVEVAYLKAISLVPDEPRFKEGYNSFKNKAHKKQ